MARREVHTVKTDTGWATKLSGGKVLSNHRKKSTASAAGRKQSIDREGEHVIQKVDGTIGEKNSISSVV